MPSGMTGPAERRHLHSAQQHPRLDRRRTVEDLRSTQRSRGCLSDSQIRSCIRPIWHHKEERIKAHILVCFLAYALWKTLQQWQSRAGLGDAPRNILTEFSRIHAADIVLPLAELATRVTDSLCGAPGSRTGDCFYSISASPYRAPAPASNTAKCSGDP